MSAALAVIETMTGVELFKPGTIDPILDRIKAEVRAYVADISTEQGRKALTSLCFKVAKSRTFIESLRVELVSGEKKRLKVIDAEGSRIWDELEMLQKEARKPLTDWENAEKVRVAGHEAALKAVECLSAFAFTASVGDVRQRMESLEGYEGRDWEEFAQRFKLGHLATSNVLERYLKLTLKDEADKAELEQLKAAEAARLSAEHDERLKAEAKAEAEAVAGRLAQQVAADEARQRAAVDQHRRDAEEREAAAVREVARVKEQAVRDAAAAVIQERARVAEALRLASEADAKREANAKHCAKINGAIVAALIALEGVGLSEDQATAVVAAMAQGLIPNVKIAY